MHCPFQTIILTFTLIHAVYGCMPHSVPVESQCEKRVPGKSCEMKLTIDRDDPSYRRLFRVMLLWFDRPSKCSHFCVENQNITEIGEFTFDNVANVKLISLKGNCIYFIKAIWFYYLKLLEEFILSKNKLYHLDGRTFKYLTSLKVLDLSYNGLKYVNKEIFYGMESLRYLDLGANKLDMLYDETFTYLTSLEELKLYGNDLVELDKQSFYNLGALVCLDLHQNRLKVFKYEVLHNLLKLKLINLEGNYITKVKSQKLVNLKSVKYINLRSNNLSHRYNMRLEGMSNLMKLDLGINKIDIITPKSFYNLVKLEELHLDKNSLKSLAVDTFAGIGNLVKLNLKGNEIHSIAHNAFVHLTNLKELYLNENNLKILSDNTFIGLENLVKLNLGENEIHKIKQNTFVDLTNLTEIHLDKNNLTILKSYTFAGLMSLSELHLENNEITTIEENTFEVMFLAEGEVNIYITGNMISELSWTIFVSSSFGASHNLIQGFNNVKLFLDGITLKCSRAICWMKHLDWKNIFENYYEKDFKLMYMNKTRYDVKSRCIDLKQYCPGKEKWCMSSDTKTCESQCTDAGTSGGKLIIDGDVCPFQYFCKCICPSCTEECSSQGKIHVDNNFDMFGCSICNCQCEKKNCFEECNGDKFMINNSTFGCPECKCICPDVQCDASCYESGQTITQNNTLGCFVCDGCKSQQNEETLRSIVTQSLLSILTLCILTTFVICIWKRHIRLTEENNIRGGFNLPLNVLTQNLDPKLAQQVKESWVDPNALRFKHLLGNGHFGIVWSGTCQRFSEKKCFVAIKVTKAEYKDTWTVNRKWNDKHELKPHFEKRPVQIQLSNKVVEDIVKEAVTMKKFSHPNILNMIGISVHGDKPCIILPLMSSGDLKKYLKVNTSKLPNRQLTAFALDAAKGMAHLAERHFLHCDLAARNCMLDSHLVVKICDFGSARSISDKDCCKSVDTSKPLPIRWMSTETIQQKKYTLESDVWSYGVLLWEIFSYGELPYKDVENKDVLRFLINGSRLTRPAMCSYHMYDIMQKCWNDDPDDRPNFSKLVDLVTKIAGKETDNNEVGDKFTAQKNQQPFPDMSETTML